MTPHRGPMSENEKTLMMCVLFPIFWPFIPVLLICWACEAVGNAIRDRYWRWKYRRQERAEAEREID